MGDLQFETRSDEEFRYECLLIARRSETDQNSYGLIWEAKVLYEYIKKGEE